MEKEKVFNLMKGKEGYWAASLSNEVTRQLGNMVILLKAPFNIRQAISKQPILCR
jgi:hypothetical protein